jgi:anti-sigma regulatory factor (Ser/Thr protein kinase)
MDKLARDADLPRETAAPRIARALVTEHFADSLSDDQLDPTRLLVSELVTSAVVHGRGRVRLRARLNEDRLLVESVIHAVVSAARPLSLRGVDDATAVLVLELV